MQMFVDSAAIRSYQSQLASQAAASEVFVADADPDPVKPVDRYEEERVSERAALATLLGVFEQILGKSEQPTIDAIAAWELPTA